MRILATAAALLLALPALAAPGSLVIVGGGLDPANADVHKAFLALRPPGRRGIAIIPSASGVPAESGAAIAEALVRHGAEASDIVLIRLAMVDDPSTPTVDEAAWAANASNPAEIQRLKTAGAVWFTGGDQLRTVRLLAPAGRETPMLAAVRTLLAEGAVIGGSSAGAAVMSGPMITNGESMVALTRPVLAQGEADNRQEGGQLVMGRGLGFFPVGLVDQHFDARARLGRLARALFELPPAERLGFGVDEDTALVVRLAERRAEVVGRATVTLVDGRGARHDDKPFRAEAMLLGVAGAGDRIDLTTLAVQPAPGRSVVRPSGGRPLPAGNAGGMAVPERPLGELLNDELVGRDVPMLERMSFSGQEGIVFRFAKAGTTRGLEGGGVGRGSATVTGVRFAIRPVHLEIEDRNQ